MQNGQDRPVANGTQKLADVPRGCEGAGLRFAIADYGRDDQLWIVECCSTRMGEHVSELTSFVDRSGSLRRAVAANAARKRKLSEKLLQAHFVFALFWIDLRVR